MKELVKSTFRTSSVVALCIKDIHFSVGTIQWRNSADEILDKLCKFRKSVRFAQWTHFSGGITIVIANP
jgi:hypothetical protein